MAAAPCSVKRYDGSLRQDFHGTGRVHLVQEYGLCRKHDLDFLHACRHQRWIRVVQVQDAQSRPAFSIFILFSQLLPATLIVVPLYVIFRQTGLYNSLIGLAIADAAFVLPLATWLMKGFFDRIPVEVEEQAMVDGCTRVGAFYRIVLPLALPGLVVVVAMSFITGWDEFFLARTLISSQSNWVFSVGLTSFETQYAIAWDEMMAAAVVFALPAVFFFLFVQRYLVSGLTSGAVKG